MDGLRKHGFWLVILAGAALILANHRASSRVRERMAFNVEAENFVRDRMRDMRGPHTQRDYVVFRVDWAITEINNGGFRTLFYNSTGDHVRETADLMRMIGAPECAALVDAGCALFPNAAPSPDFQERRAQLERFTAREWAAFRDLEEQFYARREDLHLMLKLYWDRTPADEPIASPKAPKASPKEDPSGSPAVNP